MFRKCSLCVAKNTISSALATQQTQGQCSEKQDERKLLQIAGAMIPAFRFTPFVVVRNEHFFYCQDVGLK